MLGISKQQSIPHTAPAPGAAEDAFDVDRPWQGDNQDWWDWYVTLAHDPGAARPSRPVYAATPDAPPSTDDELQAELRRPYPLAQADRDAFAANGYVKLPDVLSPCAVARLRLELATLLAEAFPSGSGQKFLSLELVWLVNAAIRRFVLSPRIAKICAELLGVESVRLYHDNVLSKEPGCGRTPWHFDDHHFPLATNDVVTAWAPAQAIPMEMGPLAFASPITAHRLVDDVPFNTKDASYDRRVGEIFAQHDVAVDETPFALGEVSFHHNLSFHMANANRTNTSRIVLANTYFADGARIVDSPTMVSGDWRKFVPGAEPGQPAASRLNPVCWPATEDFND